MPKIFEESVSCGDIANLTGRIFKWSDITGPTLSRTEWPLQVPCCFTYMKSLFSTSILDDVENQNGLTLPMINAL